MERYKESRAINSCLKTANITKMTDGNYLLNTSNYFSCIDLYPSITDITINLTFLPSDFIIISNNADNINGNIYTWNINQQNYQDKNIQVIFKKVEQEEKEPTPSEKPKDNDKETLDNKYSIFIIIGCFLGLFTIIGVICFIKSKRL